MEYTNIIKDGVKTIAYIIIIGSLFYWTYSQALFEKKELETCFREVNANIIDKYRLNKRGYFVRYQYRINDMSYTNSEPLRDNIEETRVGQEIKIKVNCLDNKISKIIPLLRETKQLSFNWHFVLH